MDLSKAYDCSPHDLLIAKPEAYSFDEPSLNLFNDYSHSRKQRAKYALHIVTGVMLLGVFPSDLF